MLMVDTAKRKKQRRILTAFFFLSGLITASWSSRIPEIQQELNLDNSGLGTVLSAIPVGLVIGLMLAGRIVANYGTRRIMLLTCILTAAALFFTTVTIAAWQLMGVLFSLGMARTIFNLSINTEGVELQKAYEKPIISRLHGIWSVASLVAAGIGTAMIIYGVKPLLHFAAIAIVAIGLALILIGKEKGAARSGERRPFFVKPDRYLFYLGAIALCAMLCEGAMFDWSVNYFDKVIHTDKKLITVGYTCFITAMATGRLFGDKLIARFGVYRMLAFNGFLMSVGFAIAALLPSLLPAAFGFLLIGFGDSILVPLVYLLASQSTKMPSGYALQAVTLIGYTGFLVGPLFIGNVSQYWGMNYAFLFLSVVSLLILLLSMRVKKLRRQA